jgi:tetratricopeptide (TPR) repeat protein
MTDRLRPLWEFDDLDETERRLRTALDQETPDEGRAEILTQLARVAGLRGDLDEGERLLVAAEGLAGGSTVAATRIHLERGRLLRSGGSPAAALPLFESAHAIACDGGHWFFAADAAHMAALATPGRDGFVAWTRRGIALAEEHDDASYWAGPLLNNLGWNHHEAGELENALAAFEDALRARQRDPENPGAVAMAQYAVGKAKRALGRSEDAIPLLEQAVAWADGAGAPDGWFHEELAEEYAAMGRAHDAGVQARLALPLLEAADSSFAADPGRRARLRALAGGAGVSGSPQPEAQ